MTMTTVVMGTVVRSLLAMDDDDGEISGLKKKRCVTRQRLCFRQRLVCWTKTKLNDRRKSLKIWKNVSLIWASWIQVCLIRKWRTQTFSPVPSRLIPLGYRRLRLPIVGLQGTIGSFKYVNKIVMMIIMMRMATSYGRSFSEKWLSLAKSVVSALLLVFDYCSRNEALLVFLHLDC